MYRIPRSISTVAAPPPVRYRYLPLGRLNVAVAPFKPAATGPTVTFTLDAGGVGVWLSIVAVTSAVTIVPATAPLTVNVPFELIVATPSSKIMSGTIPSKFRHVQHLSTEQCGIRRCPRQL